MIRFEDVFKLRVVYKSGYTHEFEVTKFKITHNSAEWESATASNRPVSLGFDDIAAVWQIGSRRRLRFGRKK